MTYTPFNGLRALVTGGASGIGLATALHLRSLGASVIALDVVEASSEHGLKTVIGDVSDSKSVEHAVGEAVDLLGGLDILVNNAGIGAQGTVEDNPDEEWLRVLNVNVVGMARVTRRLLATPAPLRACSRGQYRLRRCHSRLASAGGLLRQQGCRFSPDHGHGGRPSPRGHPGQLRAPRHG